jgi:hypothetical protein
MVPGRHPDESVCRRGWSPPWEKKCGYSSKSFTYIVGTTGRRVTVGNCVDGCDSQGRWSTGEDGQTVEMGGTGNEILEGTVI